MADISQASPAPAPTAFQPEAGLLLPSPFPVPAQAQEPPRIQPALSANYFIEKRFEQDVAAFSQSGYMKTGYQQLDLLQPFYPGLYCIGAISSLGKTTFVTQLADQQAALHRHVLYFSLEQSEFELYSKSLARGFYRTNQATARAQGVPPWFSSNYPVLSSIDIRRGMAHSYCPKELDEQIFKYTQAVGNRIAVFHGMFSINVEKISEIVINFVEKTNIKPVVIIDYLQIVAPSEVNKRPLDGKASIDHIVHTLKALQSKYGLTMLLISSLNRQNYLAPVDFESFKESGGIEYTADVMWGLQLSILENPNFYYEHDDCGKPKRETSLKQKREMINEEKARNPRSIELVCLKNRYGISNYKVPFKYYPRHDLFWEEYNPNDTNTWITEL